MSWWWFQYTLFGFGYWYAQESIEKQKSINELERKQSLEAQKKAELEKEKLIAEQAYLRAQINPHFLYNVLNFLYYKALTVSDELSEGILTLSEIMHYAFREGNGSGLISLEGEVEHLKNLIKINQFRFGRQLQVRFECNGDYYGAKVIPFIFVTIVENAFKHGDLLNEEHPVVISLDYDDINGQVRFYTRNQKSKTAAEFSSGVGIANLKKRLEQWYRDRFVLEVLETDEDYSTLLEIRL
ncbi:sensor histidine kinase [Dinghuibacter silviterrae]|nr:sensor histidine kinase [Dinghuibacter silviterrae]